MTAPGVVLALALAVGLSAPPRAAQAQPAVRIPRVGILANGSPGDQQPWALFRQSLRDLGQVEGRTLALEYRYAEGRLERFPDLASELARLPVDVILAPSTPAAQAARRATTAIPIVLVLAGNPIGDGLIQTFARPGGNVTGLTMSVGPEIGGKFLELLREAVPSVSRVAVLHNPLTAPHAGLMKETGTAAGALGLTLEPVGARRPEELDGAFAAIARGRADGLVVLPDGMFDGALRTRIAVLAAKARLPAIAGIREYTESGGLMSYGPSVGDLYRRAAAYVDRILKGAKPSDLPVERPTRFELVVNLKTAKALGLTIPPALLARADQVLD